VGERSAQIRLRLTLHVDKVSHNDLGQVEEIGRRDQHQELVQRVLEGGMGEDCNVQNAACRAERAHTQTDPIQMTVLSKQGQVSVGIDKNEFFTHRLVAHFFFRFLFEFLGIIFLLLEIILLVLVLTLLFILIFQLIG
jgi:hypothetical protein